MPHVVSAVAVQAFRSTLVSPGVANQLLAIALAFSAFGALSGYWYANSRPSLFWSDPEQHRARQHTGYSVAVGSAVVAAAALVLPLGAFLV